MTTATRSARKPAHPFPCPAGCGYAMDTEGSVAAHLAMAHPEVPMDQVAPRRTPARAAGHAYRFRIARPTREEVQATWDEAHPYAAAGQRANLDWGKKVDEEWRRRWRANVLLLKAKREFAEGEASTVVRELMPYALLRDGRTLEEAITAGDASVPLLATGGAS